jgi:hypothetical protein
LTAPALPPTQALNDIDRMIYVPFAKVVFLLLLAWGYYLWGDALYKDVGVFFGLGNDQINLEET